MCTRSLEESQEKSLTKTTLLSSGCFEQPGPDGTAIPIFFLVLFEDITAIPIFF